VLRTIHFSSEVSWIQGVRGWQQALLITPEDARSTLNFFRIPIDNVEVNVEVRQVDSAAGQPSKTETTETNIASTGTACQMFALHERVQLSL